jgi:hypothetical protein
MVIKVWWFGQETSHGARSRVIAMCGSGGILRARAHAGLG